MNKEFDRDHNQEMLKLYDRISHLERRENRFERQIGRLIQCIGEFELTDAQRYYLEKAIRGE